jgi:hypothetical protein
LSEVNGARTIRCRTIRCGQFVADNSSHGQFVARQFVAGQFVAMMGQRKKSTRKLELECADVTLELERTLLTPPSPSPSLTLTLTLSPSHPHPHPHPHPHSHLIFPVPAMIWLNYTIATNCPWRIVLQRIVHTTNCPQRIVRDELSCNELSGHRRIELRQHYLTSSQPNNLNVLHTLDPFHV